MKSLHPLIMASTSTARRKMMKNAGIEVQFKAPEMNEAEIRRAHQGLDGRGMAQVLADAKARSIVAAGAVVIGADQTLEMEGRLFNKAKSIDEARNKLKALRGQTHYLHSAVACTRNGQLIYRHTETACMKMRDFSDTFLESYLFTSGSEVLSSVGCYFYEGSGIQLFEEVQGDYYTILGLPLLPLLAFLRNAAMLPA